MELSGIAASNGIAIGYALVKRSKVRHIEKMTIDSKEVRIEIDRFEAAFRQTDLELQQLIVDLKKNQRNAESEMVEALLELLHDDEFYSRIFHKISKDCLQSETALTETTEEIVAMIQSINNTFLVERSAEIRDISKRLMNQLIGTNDWILQDHRNNVILITDELTTSYFVQLDPKRIQGCATVYGGGTSHSAIIARSMGIPFIVGLGDQLNQIKDGQLVILDSAVGKLIVDPSQVQITYYKNLMLKLTKEKQEHLVLDEAPVTFDKYPVDLLANISSISCARDAKNNGASGVGLFRTEFLFLNRTTPPSEEEQFETYREVAQIFGEAAPIIIRTMDIGGDKQTLFYPHELGQNSLLGKRGIRVSLEQVELFKTQLRAILRASIYGQIKIMFPMIAVLSEWKRAKAILVEVKEEFRLNQVNYNMELEVGMMIEVPAAALNMEQFASEVDFFSIGTNDLVQYLMAADRSNASLAYLNDSYHPIVLRVIQQVIQTANQHNKWVSMCGDLAGQPQAVALFLGMGLRKFSMNPNELAQVRTKIRMLKYSNMVVLSKEALKLNEAKEVLEYIINNC